MISNKAKEILDYIKKDSIKENLEIRLNYNDLAKSEGVGFSSGYFDHPEGNLKFPLLVVGINKEEDLWLEVLLHEYCHFKQWRENTKAWNTYVNTEEDSKDYLEATVNMESECEQNTIELSKMLNYDINETRYIKKTNAYLVFYQVFSKESKWYKNPPFEVEDILSQMPNEIIKKPLDHFISEELYQMYLKCL